MDAGGDTKIVQVELSSNGVRKKQAGVADNIHLIRWIRTFLAVAAVYCASAGARAAITISLDPSIPSPANLGTVVTWTASASDSDAGVLSYRFRVRRIGSEFHIVKDYGAESTLDWT